MKGLRSKIWAWLMALVMVIIVLLWLFQVVFLENFYYKVHFSLIEDKIMTVASHLETSNLINATDLSSALNNDQLDALESLTEVSGLGVMLINNEGDILYQESLVFEQMFKRSLATQLESALLGETQIETISHMRFDSDYWVMTHPVKDTSGKVIGAIAVTAPIEAVSETVGIIKQQLIWITGIIFVLASVVAFLIARELSRPLLKLEKATQQIAEGHFEIVTGIKRRDEIGQLARNIEEMGHSLGQIDQLRRDLIGNLSHELRTPLSVIKGYSETMIDVTGDDPVKRNKQLNLIIEETNRLTDMIQDIMDLSRLQSGQMALDRDAFDLVEVMQQIKLKFEIFTVVELVSDTEMAIVSADRSKIIQVLTNLTSNAIHHSQAVGENATKVVMKLISSERDYRVEIIDYGKGIPLEEQSKIWDRFYQIESREDGKPSGSGVGLAIVKGILEAHQFNYGVDSIPNRETHFWFEMPKMQHLQ